MVGIHSALSVVYVCRHWLAEWERVSMTCCFHQSVCTRRRERSCGRPTNKSTPVEAREPKIVKKNETVIRTDTCE